MVNSIHIINKITLVKLFAFFIIALLFSCNENKNEKKASLNINKINSEAAAVRVTMEGKTYHILQENIIPNTVLFKKDTIQFLFYANDNPLQFNLNLNNTDLLTKGSANYIIPEINTPRIKADLNFFNTEKKGMNRRIIFRKGTINIKELTKNKLEMSFDGEGGGMMDRKNSFPISGKVNVSY